MALVLAISGPRAYSAPQRTAMTAADGVQRITLLPSGPGNARNSEGDFIRLKGGRLIFVYSHFTGTGGDDDAAYLASRYSDDGGRSWTAKDEVVVRPSGGMNNLMSVSLRRLPDGAVGLFYLRKNSVSDCRPLLRRSYDEGRTWGEPTEIITDEIGYYVTNNDRVTILPSGRILLPVALHKGASGSFISRGRAMCYVSDDGGQTWRRTRSVLELTDHPKDPWGLQEPGVVQLRDGRLMMLCRTSQKCQYVSYSWDRGETWSPVKPTAIRSPLSPASFKRIPETGDLLLVWNDQTDPSKGRTPLNTAISRDDGKTWEHRRVLEDDPAGCFCYTAISFAGGRALLAYCICEGLTTTRMTSIPLRWLYQDDSPPARR